MRAPDRCRRPAAARLVALAAHVLPDLPAADIGTDHGYLPVWLVETNRCPWVVAGDARAQPLAAAARTVAAAGVAHRIELRQGDGLQVLRPGEVATVILAGLGGSVMIGILARSPEVMAALRRLVLQPNIGVESLRRWLHEQDWHLAGEDLTAAGGRVYVTLVADPGPGPALTPADLMLGPHLRGRTDGLYRVYVQELLHAAERALAGVQRARRPDPGRRQALADRVALLRSELAATVAGAPAGTDDVDGGRIGP